MFTSFVLLLRVYTNFANYNNKLKQLMYFVLLYMISLFEEYLEGYFDFFMNSVSNIYYLVSFYV